MATKTRAERLRDYLREIAPGDDIREFRVDETRLEAMRGAQENVRAAGPGAAFESLPPRVTAAQVNDGLEALHRGASEIPPEAAFGIEAIIIPDKRPAMPLAQGTYDAVHPLWLHLNDPPTKARLTGAAKSIGRIEVPGSPYPYGGTGFVIGDGLVMTNRHVAEIFALGLGDHAIAFRPGIRPGFSRAFAPDNSEQPALPIRRVVMIHPYWDMAILAVEGLPGEAAPLVLDPRSVDGFAEDEIAVIGYPAFDPRNDPAVQKTVFDNRFGIKQLQPGLLKQRFDTESFSKVVHATTHDCSTLGGNSGSALVHIESGRVLGLHFGGVYLARNYAVPASELALDGRVTQAGVNFDPTINPDAPPSWSGWWRDADDAAGTPGQGEAAAGAGASAPPPSTSAGHATVAQPVPAGPGPEPATLDVVIPIHLTIRVGGAASATVSIGRETPIELERAVEPTHDPEYGNRKGFDENFLGIRTPLPQARDPSVLARTRDGKDRLDYQNFSLRMHAARRLALVTASNVYAAGSVKTPEGGRLYTRKALSGLGAADQEKWFADPRLDAGFQLPDVFYTRDDGAFDKGHIVRRDDVAWGLSYEDLRRANGDSFHVTNCSPQVAGFNRSTDGTDNWGDLENVVLRQAAGERLCVLAGPVLSHDDPRFLGTVGPRQRIAIQIPTRFWKVILATSADGLAAYGFMLDQDLSAMPTTEFVVPSEFQPFLVPIATIAETTGVVFAPEVVAADEFEGRGLEIAAQANIGRSRTAHAA
jgi:endonuclease G